MVASHDVIRSMTQKVLALAVAEMGRDETKKHIRENLVDPLIKMLHTQLMPYLLMVMVVIIAILLMSMMTLTLSAMFYFKRTNAV